MGKGKVIEDKPRKRKISNRNDEPNNSTLSSKPQTSAKPAPSPKPVSEKPRIRKPHRKHQGKLFTDLWKELPRKMTIGAIAVVTVVALLHFGVQRYQTLRRQRQVYSPIHLPKMISPNETSPDASPDLFWGSYRPNVFFGMAHRSPHSMLFGLAWTSFEGQSVHIRHQCTNEDGIKR